MVFGSKTLVMPSASDALPGRTETMPVAEAQKVIAEYAASRESSSEE